MSAPRLDSYRYLPFGCTATSALRYGFTRLASWYRLKSAGMVCTACTSFGKPRAASHSDRKPAVRMHGHFRAAVRVYEVGVVVQIKVGRHGVHRLYLFRQTPRRIPFVDGHNPAHLTHQVPMLSIGSEGEGKS